MNSKSFVFQFEIITLQREFFLLRHEIIFSTWYHYFTRIRCSNVNSSFFREFFIFAWIRFFNVNSFFVAKSLLYDVKCTHNLAKIKLTRVSQTQNDQYVKKRQIFKEFIAETQKNLQICFQQNSNFPFKNCCSNHFYRIAVK